MGLKKLQILVVDDEVDIRELIREQFENFGFNVDVAGGGDEGWALFKKRSYDVVITDIRMPEGMGPELLKKIKSENVHEPMVFFISGNFEFSVEQIFDFGADGLFPKPFSATVLRDSIKKASLTNQQKWAQKKLNNFVNKFSIAINETQSNIKIGRGGLYIQYDDDLPNLGDEIEFEFDLKGDLGVIKGDGVVVWVRPVENKEAQLGRGMGIEIRWLDKDCIQKYKLYIDNSSILPYIPKG
jgi:CheY-like chemotaxis protein/Tfp pilus assembly protein PilZ